MVPYFYNRKISFCVPDIYHGPADLCHKGCFIYSKILQISIPSSFPGLCQFLSPIIRQCHIFFHCQFFIIVRRIQMIFILPFQKLLKAFLRDSFSISDRDELKEMLILLTIQDAIYLISGDSQLSGHFRHSESSGLHFGVPLFILFRAVSGLSVIPFLKCSLLPPDHLPYNNLH